MATSAVRPAITERALFGGAAGGYLVCPRSGLYRHDGPDALDLLQRITTNDLLSLRPGEAKRTVIADERGRVVDVPWVIMRDQDDLLLMTDASDTKSVERAILKYTIIEDACLTSLESQLTRVKLVGEAVGHAYAELGLPEDAADMAVGDFWAVDEVHLLISDFGSVRSCDMVFPTQDLANVLARISEDYPLLSERLFHWIRVDLGVPWPGYEFKPAVNALEAGLRDLIDFDKGCYVGQEVIARLDTYDKVQRSLVKLRCHPESTCKDFTELALDADIMIPNGRKVGWVSSSEVMPGTGEWVGLGFVRNDWSYEGCALATREGHLLVVVS